MPVRQHAAGFLEVLNGGVHRSVEYRLLAAILDRNVETLAEKRHLLIVDAELERRAVRDAHHVRVGIAAAGCDQSLAQGLELRLVGLEAPQIGRRVGAEGDRFDHFHGIGQHELRIEVRAHALRRDAAAAGVASVSQHGKADLDLGVGERFGVGGLFVNLRRSL